MYCSNCGGELLPDSKFCRKCGVRAKPSTAVVDAGDLRRPAAVALLAVLNHLLGGLYALLAVSILAFAPPDVSARPLTAAALLGLAVLFLICGYGLWKLKKFGRRMQLVLAWIGLLGFPVGTLISALVLYYLYQPRTKVLFSEKSPGQLTAEERAILVGSRDAGTAVVILTAAIAMLVFVGFTGIVAAIAIPNLLNAIDRGKQKRTMADMRSISTAMESYAIDYDVYPLARGIEEVRELLVPLYAPSLPDRDGWGHQWELVSDADGYVLISPGKDGIIENREPRGSTSSFNDDIVQESGVFLQWPEGMQQ